MNSSGCFGVMEKLAESPMRQVPRAIFPLPFLKDDAAGDLGGLSRSMKRRLNRRHHLCELSNKAVESLNLLEGHKVAGCDAFVGAGQRKALAHIHGLAAKLGPCPEGLSSAGAFEELRGASLYTDPECKVAPYNHSLVSLPAAGSQPRELASLLGDEGDRIVEGFIKDHLLKPEQAAENLKSASVSKAYVDPTLAARPKEYKQILNWASSAGVVELTLKKPVEEAGLFFVTKKSGRLRLVIDARRSNCWFSAPEKVELALGNLFDDLESRSSGPIYIGHVDIVDAFWQFSLPIPLRQYFGLPTITAGLLGISTIKNQPVSPSQVIYPRMAALPMGWSHAVYWCQKVHRSPIEKSFFCPTQFMQDQKRIPDLAKGVYTVYLDNFICLSEDKSWVESATTHARECLHAVGLPTHEEGFGVTAADLLGWHIDGVNKCVRPSSRRAWKCIKSIDWIVARPSVKRKDLERVLGHLTFLFLICREGLSIFSAVYRQLHSGTDSMISLWPSVVRELKMFRGVIPLLCRSLAIPWSPVVHACDASSWGFGVLSACGDVDEIAAAGRQSDRWFFIEEHEGTLRDRALRGECAEQSSADAVPDELISLDWNVCASTQWKSYKHIVDAECKGILWSVRHFLRSSGNFQKRFLVLSDSMSNVCSVQKGRSSAFDICLSLRRLAAHTLASGCRCHVRWIASEHNPADGPSRGHRIKHNGTPHASLHLYEASTKAQVGSSTSGHHRETCKGDSCGDQHVYSRSRDGIPSGQEWKLDLSTSSRVSGGSDRESSSEDCQSKGTSSSGSASREASGQGCSGSTTKRDSCSEMGFSCPVNSKVVLCLERAIAGMGPQQSFYAGGRHSNQKYGLGRHPSGMDERDIPRGRQIPRGECNDQLLCVHESMVQQTRHNEAPTEPPGLEGLAQNVSSHVQAPRERRAVGTDCNEAMFPQQKNHGQSTLDDTDILPKTIRGLQAEGKRCCSSKHESCRRKVGHCPSPAGGRDSSLVENRRIRRKPATGPGRTPVVRSSAKGPDCRKEPRGPTVPAHPKRSEQGSSGDGSGLRVGSRPHPVSSSPHRSLSRFRLRASDTEGSQEARQVALRRQCPQVREGRPNVREVPQARSRHPTRGNQKLSVAPKTAMLKTNQGPPRLLRVRIFMEVFAGSARLSHAMHLRGYHILAWDVVYGAAYDIACRKNRSLIRGWLSSGVVLAIHFGTPCNAWSRIRGVGIGPPAIRSDDMVMGLANLSDKSQATIEMGNLTMIFTIQCLILCDRLYIPGSFENGARTRIWIAPHVVSFCKRRNVRSVTTDYCQWGEKWMKSTTFCGVHVDFQLIARRCCRVGGVCSRTKLPHQQLKGFAPDGRFWTAHAEAYPKSLCGKLALCFDNAVQSREGSKFASLIT